MQREVDTSVRILGVRFFNGTAAEALAHVVRVRGYVVVPAAPALLRLCCDEEYRTALTNATVAIADSGLMVLCWRILRLGHVTRTSGLTYLKHLIGQREFREADKTFFILPNEAARGRTITWARKVGLQMVAEDSYVAPQYDLPVQDPDLAAKIDNSRPTHIVIAIGGGTQEKLAHYLTTRLSYRPAIHCIGAALGFLTGDQVSIPTWADRLYLGWLFRLIAQPRIFVPRLWSARKLPWLIIRYGSELPLLREKAGQAQ